MDRSATSDGSVSTRSEILDTLEATTSQNRPVLVFVVKVERLKMFNHAHGIRMGDQLLASVGQQMIGLAGRPGCVGKLRGDVFMMLVTPDPAGVDPTVERIGSQLRKPVSIGGQEYFAELKIGVAHADSARADVDNLLVEASAAMRAAVDSRSSIVVADDELRSEAYRVAIVDRDLKRAIENNHLSFVFQPIVTLADSVVHGAEALLRWQHPGLGLLKPEIVVPRVEALGLTDIFTEWSFNQVAASWAQLSKSGSGLEGASVSINVSEGQLSNPLLPSMIRGAVSTHGLSAENVILEVIESGPKEVSEAAAMTLRELAEDGHLIVLDDFGTGFNALEYFLRFPVHGIKFDRSLVSSMRDNDTARTIVRGVARIAEDLGVATVAEGIEDDEMEALCREMSLVYGQGWYFGGGESAPEFAATASASRAGLSKENLHRDSFAVG